MTTDESISSDSLVYRMDKMEENVALSVIMTWCGIIAIGCKLLRSEIRR